MLPLLPDAEVLAVAVLKAQAPITALCGDRIDTVIPLDPIYPLIRVTKVGDFGSDIEGCSDVVVQIECWAEDDAQASFLARTVQACRIDMRMATAGGWVGLVDDPAGPIATPDPDSDLSRYQFDLELRVGY